MKHRKLLIITSLSSFSLGFSALHAQTTPTQLWAPPTPQTGFESVEAYLRILQWGAIAQIATAIILVFVVILLLATLASQRRLERTLERLNKS